MKQQQKLTEVTVADVQRAVAAQRNSQKAKNYARFFKTGKGEYGFGDQFAGLTVPQSRVIAKRFAQLGLEGIQKLLQSKIHEERLIALMILVQQFAMGSEKTRAAIYRFYLKQAKRVNNWDLVDCSADKIVGAFLLKQSHQKLLQLARSSNLWERRIAIVATLAFIRADRFAPTLELVQLLKNDAHDLIHKAMGWMLREVGKRHRKTLTDFLNEFATTLPRTTLRYAIEHYSETERQHYLRMDSK